MEKTLLYPAGWYEQSHDDFGTTLTYHGNNRDESQSDFPPFTYWRESEELNDSLDESVTVNMNGYE